jgi:hypothetical protein
MAQVGKDRRSDRSRGNVRPQMRADKRGIRRATAETHRQQVYSGSSGKRTCLPRQERLHGANDPLAYDRHGDTSWA